MTDDEVTEQKDIDRMEEAEKKDHEENANGMMSDAEKEYTEAQGLENQNHELLMDLSDAREKVLEHILNGDEKAHDIEEGEILSRLAGKQGMSWQESLEIIADYNMRPDILTNGLFDKNGNLDKIKYEDRTMTIVGMDLPSNEWIDTYKGLQANVSQLESQMSGGAQDQSYEKDGKRYVKDSDGSEHEVTNPDCVYQLPAEGKGYETYFPEKRWGTKGTVDALTDVARQFNEKYPDAKIFIGALSKVNGQSAHNFGTGNPVHEGGSLH